MASVPTPLLLPPSVPGSTDAQGRTEVDVLVIGAGQSGLATGVLLASRLAHATVDR